MERLAVNGCSYMASYATGGGHVRLANKLGIEYHCSLALPGSCNNRIIRTTLKDSYQTDKKTLYIVGLSFMGRSEIPINKIRDEIEGRWLSIQNLSNSDFQYVPQWNESDTKLFIDLKLKYELTSFEDHLEDLQYRLLSMVNDLKSRGHKILIFKQPQDEYYEHVEPKKFEKLQNCVNIVDGLRWEAIPWQFNNGVKFNPDDINLPLGIRHPLPGEHGPLNNFITDYIIKNAIYLPVL
jgi:hypothetical protein